jgi:hypothetical protein
MAPSRSQRRIPRLPHVVACAVPRPTIRVVPVNHHELIAALAKREDDEPGLPIDGSTLMQRFAALAGDDGRAWEAVARATAKLRRLDWIDWQYNLWPGETAEPQAQFVDDRKLQQVIDIVVTDKGLAAIADRKRAEAATTQINVVNSTVGQLALGNIDNFRLAVLLDAIEQAVGAIDAPERTRQEARSIIQRMRSAAGAAVSSTAQAVLDAAVRRSLGL